MVGSGTGKVFFCGVSLFFPFQFIWAGWRALIHLWRIHFMDMSLGAGNTFMTLVNYSS